MAIASNEAFSGWTKTFTDPRLSAVISTFCRRCAVLPGHLLVDKCL